MITLRKRCWDDKEYDNCGNTAIAVLEVDSIDIPLCAGCLGELTEELNEYNNTIFCYKCSKFIMNKWGEWGHGGSCKKMAEQKGITLTVDTAGYDCCVDCLDTCKDAKPMEV